MRLHFGALEGARVPILTLGALLAAGCGGGEVKGKSATALSARLDLMESENANLEKMLKKFGARITELENVILKQQNDLKKIKVAIGTAPKTLEPSEPGPAPVLLAKPAAQKKAAAEPVEDTSYGWVDSAIYAEDVVAGGEEQGDPAQQDEPKIVLTLYGTPKTDAGVSAPLVASPMAGVSTTVGAASLLQDLGGMGGAVALKIPVTGGAIPQVDVSGGQPTVPGQGPGTGSTGQAVDPYAQGVLKYEAGEWSSAILYFDIYLKHDPSGGNAMSAIFLKAESLYQMGKYLEAIGQFELVMERWPGGSRASDAKLRIGRCYEKLGDKAKAASVYEEVAKAFPGTKQAKKAATLMAGLK